MLMPKIFALLLAGGSLLMTVPAEAQPSSPPNQVVGTWRIVVAQIDPEGKNLPAYGTRPSGLLVFTPDLHYVEVLTDADILKFTSNVRGQGTAEENRAAMAGSIGFFGICTVDDAGAFSGNRVEGSTFPNWIGDVRTTKELRLFVKDDQMTETFQRPDGTRIAITWQRIR